MIGEPAEYAAGRDAVRAAAGSAQNPLTLNRYLYANANPATLVDPDGHCSQSSEYAFEHHLALCPEADAPAPAKSGGAQPRDLACTDHPCDVISPVTPISSALGYQWTILDSVVTIAAFATPNLQVQLTEQTQVTLSGGPATASIGVGTLDKNGTTLAIGADAIDVKGDGSATVTGGNVSVGTDKGHPSAGLGTDIPAGGATGNVTTTCGPDKGGWFKCDRQVKTTRASTFTSNGTDYTLTTTVTTDFITKVKPPKPGGSSSQAPAMNPFESAAWSLLSGQSMPKWGVSQWDTGATQAGYAIDNGSDKGWYPDPGYQTAAAGSSVLLPVTGGEAQDAPIELGNAGVSVWNWLGEVGTRGPMGEPDVPIDVPAGA